MIVPENDSVKEAVYTESRFALFRNASPQANKVILMEPKRLKNLRKRRLAGSVNLTQCENNSFNKKSIQADK